MTGRERILNTLAGGPVDRLPAMPIVHAGLARAAGVPLGRFYSDAEVMADVIIGGFERFGWDGVQLTLGVAAEPEALGATVEQPPDGAPLLRQHLLADVGRLPNLATLDPATGGRIPLYHAAVRRVADRIGDRAFVLSTLRGPLNIASQLRGVEDMLIDMLRQPQTAAVVLEFATATAVRVARSAIASGAHAIVFGEATCSPNFISPDMYRRVVKPWHVRLMGEVKAMGWRFAGFHVCGRVLPIIEDLVEAGADFLDIDYQVPVGEAIAAAAGRIALRGNLNPFDLLLRGTPEEVGRATAAVLREAAGARWIVGSGCDIPPGTPAENLAAFAETVRGAGSPPS